MCSPLIERNAEGRQEADCPDCGERIELHGSGWWSHVGMPNGCWRVSMDGPHDGDDFDEYDPAESPDPDWMND